MGYYDRNNYVRILLDQRTVARANKDYAASDLLRALLVAQGVTVMDTKTGSEYHWLQSNTHDPKCLCRARMP